MRILYITSEDPKAQGDYQEVSMLHGLREVLGDNCIDFPRKKIMYGDFSESPKNELHGRGFSLLTEPIEDVENTELPATYKFEIPKTLQFLSTTPVSELLDILVVPM